MAELKGCNVMTVNQATVIAIFQDWVDAEGGEMFAGMTVNSVTPTSDGTFAIELIGAEKK
jgi:hypothetical protein